MDNGECIWIMNELQKIELDLFRCFAETCEKLNLNYFLVCGSALGAARHGGFIPWDDDFDVGMYREDYNKFMELAPALLPEGIFLQNYKTDPQYPYIFSKLRNSNTTFIEKLLSNFDINHGIYMDIFPLDGYPDSPSEQAKLASGKRNFRRKLFCGFKMHREFKAGALAFLLRMLGYHKRTAKTLAEYEALISGYPVKDSRIICSHGTWYGERDYIPAQYYGKGAEAVYEGIKVRVPEKCDEYLTSLYGDWRTPPDSEKQEGTHQHEICDTKRPYTFYLRNK